MPATALDTLIKKQAGHLRKNGKKPSPQQVADTLSALPESGLGLAVVALRKFKKQGRQRRLSTVARALGAAKPVTKAPAQKSQRPRTTRKSPELHDDIIQRIARAIARVIRES